MEVEALQLQVSLNMTTEDSLKSYAANSSWNKWLLNTNNKLIIFKVSNDRCFNLSSQLILLHSLAESEATHSVTGLKMKIAQRSSAVVLLKLKQIFMEAGATLAFDFGNGTNTNMEFTCNEVINN